MTCHYCRSVNADDDHRCRRCGRRLTGTAVEAPPEYAARALQNIGANALAAAIATAEIPKPQTASPLQAPHALAARGETLPRPKVSTTQSSLFAEDNVIPFSRKTSSESLPETSEMYAQGPSIAKPRTGTRKPAADTGQSALDFLPPKPQTTRLLKTTVEAAIHCDAQPASPMHRAGAAIMDAGLIGTSCALFFGVVSILGGSIPLSKQTVPIFGALFVLIALFYGFIWMIADRETLGMRWADLKLVNFGGFPPDRKTRALRMTGCFLSFCSGMIGIFWALVDEEGLTWHDHMSKTFPTLRDTGSHLIRH